VCVRFYCIRDGMSLETITARIPREMLREIERLAKKMRVDRSELIRRLLDSALKQKRIEEALEAYREGRVTLWKAAETAGLSLREMMELAGLKKITVPYSVEDLKRDMEYVLRKTRGEQQ